MSTREDAFAALVTALETTGALVSRETDIPETIPPEGYIVVSEGAADVEAVMSPLTYLIDQTADVDVMVVGVDETARDTALDVLLVAVSEAITADRTLDGAVEFAEIGAPEFEPIEANGPAKAARFPIVLSFTTTASPLT